MRLHCHRFLPRIEATDGVLPEPISLRPRQDDDAPQLRQAEVVRHERRAEDHRATEVVKPGGEPLGLPAPPVTPELALPSFVSGSSRCCGAGRSSLCLPRRVLRRGGRGLGPLSASRAARPGISPRALTPTRLTSCGLALAARTARGRVACRRHELRTLAPPRVFPTEPPPFWSPRRCRPRSTPRGRARRAPLGLRPGREGPRRARPWGPAGSPFAVRPARRIGDQGLHDLPLLVGKVHVLPPSSMAGRGTLYGPRHVCEMVASGRLGLRAIFRRARPGVHGRYPASHPRPGHRWHGVGLLGVLPLKPRRQKGEHRNRSRSGAICDAVSRVAFVDWTARPP